MIFRFANYVMTVFFILSAVVQYNDPNPLRWILIYGAAAVVCILFALQKLHWYAVAAVIGVSGIWALLKIPDLTTYGFNHMLDEVHMTQAGVPATREFLGLLIIVAWMTLLAVSAYRTTKAQR